MGISLEIRTPMDGDDCGNVSKAERAGAEALVACLKQIECFATSLRRRHHSQSARRSLPFSRKMVIGTRQSSPEKTVLAASAALHASRSG